MWYIFPQPATLGRSPTAVRYGIKNRAEAEAYLLHPILGVRLRTLVQATIDSGANIRRLFPSPHFEVDRLKFQACLTLFARLDGESGLFSRALTHFKLKPHTEVLYWLNSQPVPHIPTPNPAHQEPVVSIRVDEDDDIHSYGSDRSSDGEWEDVELQAVIDSRYQRDILQYRVKWKENQNDTRWSSAKNLRQAPLKLEDFHKANPGKDGPPINIDIWRQHYFRGQRAPRDSNDNRPRSKTNTITRADAVEKG